VPFAVAPEFKGSSAPRAASGVQAREPAPEFTGSAEPGAATGGNQRPAASTEPKRSGEPGAASGKQGPEAAALVTRIASEAFAAAGFEVIPPSDVAQIFEAAGQPFPSEDRAALAAAVAREFGATAVLTGTVHRYRERSGGDLGSTQPASVGLDLALYTAPGVRTLWTARFDHTQQALSENALVAPRYPGAGSRWLTAAELARWGLDIASEELAKQRAEQK